MRTATHTPTPWRVSEDRIVAGTSGLHIAQLAMTGMGKTGPANAEHIVRCVNAHDELVAALLLVLLACEKMGVDDDLDYAPAFKQARAALAKVAP